MTKPVIVIGGGGHAKVVIDVLRLRGIEILGLVAPEFEKGTEVFQGIECLGNDDVVFEHGPTAINLVNGIGFLPKSTTRTEIYKQFSGKGFEFLNVIHPSAILSDDIELGTGIQIMAGAIIQPGTVINDNVIINTGAIVDHDCRISSHCHIAPGSVLCGNVKLGEQVFVGSGAVIIQNKSIEDGAIVAAGALIT